MNRICNISQGRQDIPLFCQKKAFRSTKKISCPKISPPFTIARKKKTDLCRRLSCREYAEKSVCHEAFAKCYFTASSFLPFPSADGGIELFTSSWKYAANSLSLNGVPASGSFGFPSTQ